MRGRERILAWFPQIATRAPELVTYQFSVNLPIEEIQLTELDWTAAEIRGEPGL
jgi:hypothetical protein